MPKRGRPSHVSASGTVSAVRPYRLSGRASLREGVKQIARPLIASSTVFHYARHEVWTPMLASRDEKEDE